MSNLRVLASSFLDATTLNATSEDALYPLTNLQKTQPSRKWRSTDLSTQALWANMGSFVPCSGFCLYRHNLSHDATVRLSLFTTVDAVTVTNAVYSLGFVTITTQTAHGMYADDDNAYSVKLENIVGMTDINDQVHDVVEVVDATNFKIAYTTAQSYTSGGDCVALKTTYERSGFAFDPAYGWGLEPWGISGWGGYSPYDVPPDYTVFWFDGVVADHMRVVIENPTNPDSYIEVGRIMLGDSIAPEYNFDWGVSVNQTSDTDVHRTRGGVLTSENKPSYRTLEFKLSFMTEREGIAMLGMMKRPGKTGDVLASAFPKTEGGGSALEQATTILGRVTDHSPLSRMPYGYGISVFIEESI